MGLAGIKAARALADRKGATALEYALIMAAVAAPVIAGFGAFAGRFSAFLAGIDF